MTLLYLCLLRYQKVNILKTNKSEQAIEAEVAFETHL